MLPLPPTKRQVADWARLTQKKFRKESGLFLIEGEVCVREALRSGIKLEALLLLASEAETRQDEFGELKRTPLYAVNTDAYRRISSVEISQGIVAVAKQFELKPRPSGFGLACEQVADPGNCGALIRVADFFGASELILGPGSADRWNEKVVRGSMGSLFHQPLKQVESLEELIRTWPGDSIALTAHGGKALHKRPRMKEPLLLVLGNETRGLTPSIENSCTHKLTLKPAGGAESLNLVTAAAVFAYELGLKNHD
ncbi:RNA methyltransferase [bacterium]|nr:RNA methyltransferase [bacterium]MBU1636033.1 RNA methyltransferase [bacterium]